MTEQNDTAPQWWVYIVAEDYWAAGPYATEAEATAVRDTLYNDSFGRGSVRERPPLRGAAR